LHAPVEGVPEAIQQQKTVRQKKEAGPMTITKALNRGWTAFSMGGRRGLLPVFGGLAA
jgi:hypothetical protein